MIRFIWINIQLFRSYSEKADFKQHFKIILIFEFLYFIWIIILNRFFIKIRLTVKIWRKRHTKRWWIIFAVREIWSRWRCALRSKQSTNTPTQGPQADSIQLCQGNYQVLFNNDIMHHHCCILYRHSIRNLDHRLRFSTCCRAINLFLNFQGWFKTDEVKRFGNDNITMLLIRWRLVLIHLD